MHTYYLLLGSNAGFPLLNLAGAERALKGGGITGPSSSTYLTEPVGRLFQAAFLNRAVKYRTELLPRELMLMIKEIERAMGRPFTSSKAQRSIDIDIAAGDVKIIDPVVTIPHPSLSGRKFMLVPLCELEGGYVATECGKTFNDLLIECADSSFVEKL